MLTDFYRCWEQPFGLTPDSRSLYLSPTHGEALGSLMSGIQAERGLFALVAEPGMGKTTLLYHLMERLRGSMRVAFLFQTQCSSFELMRYLMSELGLESEGKDIVGMHEALNKVLFDKMRVGERFVLIIDEAQNLAADVLETVRLISNIETPHAKLMQIVLAGQPQLADNLTHPDMEQMRQRIATVSSLTPLNTDETAAFIENRLQAAGYRGGPLFTPSALSVIAEKALGVPRNINRLCFSSMTVGYALKRKQINGEVVREAFRGLDIQRLCSKGNSNNKPVRKRMIAAPWLFRVAALLVVIAADGFFIPMGNMAPTSSKELVTQPNGAVTIPMAFQTRDLASTSVDRTDLVSPRQTEMNLGGGEALTGSQTAIAGANDPILPIARRHVDRGMLALSKIKGLNRKPRSEGRRTVHAFSRTPQVRKPADRTGLQRNSQERQP
jgi:general secretion pathway protein A